MASEPPHTALPPPSPSLGSATPSTTAYSQSQGTMAENGNRDLPKANGEGESSKGTAYSDLHQQAVDLSSYIFNVGYIHQQWADIEISFFDERVKLHRIILARSPFLHQIMLNYQPGATIRLTFSDDNITPESVHIALQHLYKPPQHLVTADNARSVLATAFMFEGMPELTQHAYTICRDTMTHEKILDYVQWLDQTPAAAPQIPQRSNGTMFGSVNVHNGQAAVTERGSNDVWKEEEGGRYGEWSTRLKQDVFEYLVRILPESLMETSQSLANDPILLSVYTHLPFELFKSCLQSPQLPITPTQNRFAFAKKVIAQRKKQKSSAGMEESVVLAVSSQEGTVHITRKPKRTRAPLWKVEG